MKKLLNQLKTPIFDVIRTHAERQVTSFHTPGHKNGQGIDLAFKDFIGDNTFKVDLTVFPEVDSLHDPVSCIKEGQELYAELVGAKKTFFLLNGSSMGNQAMFLAAFKPGDSVIISRNAHKSAMSGIILSGVWPIWIQPELDSDFDVFFDSSSEQIEDALNKFPEAKAVFITNPTYNGIMTDLEKIAKLVHNQGKILLVDEAHGAHLGFNKKLPGSAIQCGADLVVQSAHKTLAVLSQGSVLHYNSEIVDMNKVRKVVSLIQTTSPNYLILASLDVARRQMYENGEKLLDKMVDNANYFLSTQDKFKKFRFLTKADVAKNGFNLDTLKITINVTETGIEGQVLSEILAKDYNIQFDCADFFNLIAILGVGTTKKDLDCLVEALLDIEKRCDGHLESNSINFPELTTEMVFSPRDVFLSEETELVSLSDAAGYISAQTLTPYPPGIPVLIPGERITPKICEYLQTLDSRSIRVSGQEHKKLEYLKVLKV
ncbi:MAG: aminotransferase class I/II-fold pyridoxal phosphate-dependent enzyme [bacterium]|nr:aminotransferase class I/II-fold pyridoxal phosphate-dependent enzyme [bacterium]